MNTDLIASSGMRGGLICRELFTMRESGSSSPAGWRTLVLACFLCIAISIFQTISASPALAATWPLSTSELSASCSFHQTYTAGDTSYVHSGIDIPASAGMQISSPLAGTVRFTGAVPSGDSRTNGSASDKTMQAVSIELQDGKVITLMPFASIAVAEGQKVSEGEGLGLLASRGDISTSAPHLHMGYKKGSMYLDPMQLFGVVGTRQSNTESAPATSPSSLLEAPESGLFTASPSLAPEATPSSAPVEEPAPEAMPESFGAIETGAYSWQPKPHESFSFVSFIGKTLEPLVSACYGQLVALVDALRALSKGTGIPLSVLLGAVCVLALIATVGFIIVCIRLFVPYLNNIWRIQKSRLSTCGRGDSMHKLFPASGAAFMSRSRIARGR